MSKIITRIICPRWQWIAYHQGDETSPHFGVGLTEAEALADLALKDEERAPAGMPLTPEEEAVLEAALDQMIAL